MTILHDKQRPILVLGWLPMYRNSDAVCQRLCAPKDLAFGIPCFMPGWDLPTFALCKENADPFASSQHSMGGAVQQ